MKRNNKTAAIALAVLLSGCAQDNASETVVSTTDWTTAAETTTAASETTTEKTTTTAETTTTVAETTTTTSEIATTTTAAETTTTTAEVTDTPETTTATVVTTAETTTTTAVETTVTTTTSETTTTPKTKKTKKTTTTPEETTVPETTTTPETTTVPETTESTTTAEPVKGDIYIDGEAYKLTFSDEFDGNALDMSKWEYCPEWKRQDLECYWKNECVSVSDGNLVITAEDAGDRYNMGAIRSKGKFEQAYGYFEVRCTLNTTPGYWTAFWLMGESVANEDGFGTDGTEIDIMESAYFEKGIHHGLHWDGYGVNHQSIGKQTQNSAVYDGGYHIFSLLWTETEYVFYIDGQETWRTSAEEAGGVCAAPLYLKFTSETGSWTAGELTSEGFPDNVYVDYIRVYSKA